MVSSEGFAVTVTESAHPSPSAVAAEEQEGFGPSRRSRHVPAWSQQVQQWQLHSLRVLGTQTHKQPQCRVVWRTHTCVGQGGDTHPTTATKTSCTQSTHGSHKTTSKEVRQIAAEQRVGALVWVYEHGAKTSCAHQHIAPVRCEGGRGGDFTVHQTPNQTKPMPRSPPHSAAASSVGDPFTGSVTGHVTRLSRPPVKSKSKSKARGIQKNCCVSRQNTHPLFLHCWTPFHVDTSWRAWVAVVQRRMQRISCLVTRHAAHAASTPRNETAAHTQYNHTSTDKHFWHQTEVWVDTCWRANLAQAGAQRHSPLEANKSSSESGTTAVGFRSLKEEHLLNGACCRAAGSCLLSSHSDSC